MPKHGTRRSRADQAKISWRGEAGRRSGELWDAKDRIAVLENALRDCIASLEGYRRNHDDHQPCDAEQNARRVLTQ